MSLIARKLQQSRRLVVAASLTVLLAAWSPIVAFSQEGIVARGQEPPAPAGQQQNPAQNPITQPLALSPEVTHQRVGIRDGEVQALALQDAITMALQNNLDIEQFRQGVQIAERNLFALRGVYDILSTSDVNYRSQTIPIASIFGGGGSTGSSGSSGSPGGGTNQTTPLAAHGLILNQNITAGEPELQQDITFKFYFVKGTHVNGTIRWLSDSDMQLNMVTAGHSVWGTLIGPYWRTASWNFTITGGQFYSSGEYYFQFNSAGGGNSTAYVIGSAS